LSCFDSVHTQQAPRCRSILVVPRPVRCAHFFHGAPDLDYLIALGGEVGSVLMECAHNGLRWNDLSEHQQALVTDFANVFRADSVKRGEALEVECNG
jgi:hypothetical protein